MKIKSFIFLSIILLIICSGYTYCILILQSTGGQPAVAAAAGEVSTTEEPAASFSDFFHSFILLKPAGIILFSLLVVVVFSCIGYLYFFIISRPLKKLTEALISVINGDYDIKLPEKGKNEITLVHHEFNRMVKNFRKKLAMQKYVSKSTVDMIDNLKTGEFTQEPMRKEMAILFSDVRGFTAFSEEHDPFFVVTTINTIFNIQVDIIHKYEGDIDKFVGDEIMATFHTSGDAFKAAWEIQKKIAALNKTLPVPLPVGIGITFGEAVVGAIGAAEAMDWTAIGNTVNEAARLCSVAAGGSIYISEDAFKKFRTKKTCKEEEIKVKGKKNKIKVYIFDVK